MWGSVFHPALRLIAAARRARLESHAGRLERLQRETLLEKIRANADSAFGRKHHFDEIRTVDDLRRNVPLSTYGYFEPYIEKVLKGDHRALFGPRERLRFVALTSGTTQRAKHVPITDTFMREYRLGWWIWGSYAVRDHLSAFRSRVLHITGSLCEERTSLGVPCGSVSGFIASMQPAFIRRMYVLPAIASYHIKDGATRYYVAMRFAATKDVSMFITANPGSILAVAQAGTEHHEELIRDVRDGTITFFEEPEAHVARELRGLVKPDPQGAGRLEEIRRRTGRLHPKDLWPGLGLIACWKGGVTRYYAELFTDSFGDTPVRDIGLIASEGRMTITLSSEGSAGVLDLTSHFYEFIPVEEAQSESPSTLLAHELEVGRSYLIVLTTSAGLYRYNINDVVKVVDFFRDAPVLEFQHKGSGTSSITGEKISEFQVVTAAKEASGIPGGLIDMFVMVPRWGQPPSYSVLIEEGALGGLSEAEFLDRFERSLRRLNIQYEEERILDRLGPIHLKRLSKGTWKRYRELKVERNRGQMEQYKHVYLNQDLDFVERLEETLGIGAADHRS